MKLFNLYSFYKIWIKNLIEHDRNLHNCYNISGYVPILLYLFYFIIKYEYHTFMEIKMSIINSRVFIHVSVIFYFCTFRSRIRININIIYNFTNSSFLNIFINYPIEEVKIVGYLLGFAATRNVIYKNLFTIYTRKTKYSALNLPMTCDDRPTVNLPSLYNVTTIISAVSYNKYIFIFMTVFDILTPNINLLASKQIKQNFHWLSVISYFKFIEINII